MKKIYLIITLLVVSFSCDKKETTLYGDITGRVLNSRSSEPLQGAIVSLTPTNMSSATGSDGTYSFNKLEPQQYSVLVSKDGFQSNTINMTVEPGENRFGDILLTPIDPILSVSSTSLSFGATETQIPLEVTNNGGGTLIWAASENIEWLTINPNYGETTNEVSVLAINVNRSGLTPSTYSQTFIITSNGGSATVSVSMTVAVGNQAPDAQFTVSPETGSTATNFYFDANESTDDVTEQAELFVRWQWETGGEFSTWTKAKTETHIFDTEGQKIVTLEVKDAEGAVGTTSKTIDVSYAEPFISVSNPNSATSWNVGSSQTITWNHNISDNFKIELYLNGELNRVIANSVSGGSSKEQAGNGKSTGAFSWQIPTDLNTSSSYKVKVSSVNNESLFGNSPSFTISAFYINITAPADGTVWVKESQYSITWEDNISENVKIDIFKGGSLFNTIVTSVASNGSYSWTIPSTLVQATDYQVKVSSTTNPDLFSLSQFFTIVDKPFITVITPNENSYWAAQTTETIDWETNITEPVKIDLYNGSTFVQNIAQSTAGVGKQKSSENYSFTWNIPSNLSTSDKYKIKISSTVNTSIIGYSTDFVITEVPYIQVKRPNASDSWMPGTTQTVLWSDNITENVNIALFKGETFVLNITSSTPSSGSYSWAIPLSLTAADDYKVKITSNTNSELYGESESFEIKGYITVSKPDASTLWEVGMEQLIEWQDNIDENVLIELFKGTTLVYTIAEDATSNGTYNFTPAETLANGTDYKVKISSLIDPNAVGFSQYFEIKLVTLPTVTTNSVTEITSTTATCGGNVISNGEATITARGLCWGTNENPTISDYHTEDGTGTGEFTSEITELTPNTTYYVRAYATNSIGTGYGNEMVFTTALPDGPGSIIVDIDGNEYNTVWINSRQWTKENLRATKLNDGTIISLVTSSIWSSFNIPAYCYYNNEQANYESTYGALYNWHTINTGKLCPTGWHVPTDEEWYAMENYVDPTINDPNATYWRGTDGGTKLKATSGWNSNGNGTDNFGFSALPGGLRISDGSFGNIGTSGYWWSSFNNTSDTPTAWCRGMQYTLGTIYRKSNPLNLGYSVRCIKD